MSPRLSLLALSLLAATASTALAQAPAPMADNTPVIEAGTLSITKAEFERLVIGERRLGNNALNDPNAKRALGNDFGRAFALEAEARRRKLDQSASVQLRIRHFTQQLLANELVQSLRRDLLQEDTQLRAAYDANRDAWAQPRVRQILIRTPGSQVPLKKGQRELSDAQAKAKAEALLARLAKGGDFAALAKAESDDTGSAARGGDLGFVVRGTTAAPFEAAAYALPLNELSQVVKTEFGYHILRVEDRQPMPYDMAKAAIANELAHAQMDKLIQGGFKLNTAYFDSK